MSRTNNVFWGLLLSFTSLLSVYCYAATPATEVTITATKTPANASQYSPSLVLYDMHTNKLGGWNHTLNFAEEFVGLQRSVEHYQVSSETTKTQDFYATTLVKKLGDWNHQHANGLIADLTDDKVFFSQVAGIEIKLKIDSASSHIPSKADILAIYGQLLTAEQLSQLDDENVYLSFALVGPMSATMTFNGDYLLKLDTASQIDQWLRVTIPTSHLTIYSEEHYQEQPITFAAAQNQAITGLRIMAETASTKVIRNLLLDKFNHNTPKLFKEIKLNIEYLGIVYSHSSAQTAR